MGAEVSKRRRLAKQDLDTRVIAAIHAPTVTIKCVLWKTPPCRDVRVQRRAR